MAKKKEKIYALELPQEIVDSDEFVLVGLKREGNRREVRLYATVDDGGLVAWVLRTAVRLADKNLTSITVGRVYH